MRKFLLIVLSAASLLQLRGVALSHEYKLGNLIIVHPYMLPMPPGAPVAGGYLTIRNLGDKDDRLVGWEASFCAASEIHEMTMEDGMMSMRHIKDGLVVRAHESVQMSPDGLHLMCMNPAEQIEQGIKYPSTLEFEKAGSIQVEFVVSRPKAANADHTGHSN